jgi:putative membrane protein
MTGFIIRLLVVALGLWLAAQLVPGITVHGTGTVRPLLVILTLPITVVTLGLFLLVINAAMLGLVARMFDDFTIAGFGSALLGAMVVSVTSWLASYFIGPRGRVEIIVVRHRR